MGKSAKEPICINVPSNFWRVVDIDEIHKANERNIWFPTDLALDSPTPVLDSENDTGGAYPDSDNNAGGSVLAEAEGLINGPRQDTYGHPYRDFSDTARFWSAYKGTEFSAHDVWIMMILLKISRLKNGYHRDCLVDIAGYAGTGELVQAEMEIYADYLSPDDGLHPSYVAERSS